jgi:DNA repair exonuclease SbcCD ATPase subunit
MEAAHITWRPLGQLFVERGLITQEELEEALVEQRETRKRLGTILVSRGLVSGPELTSVLVDQLGMELTKESGFGSGLWDEIRRRHPRANDRVQAEPVAPPAPADLVDEHPSPQPEARAPAPLAPVQEAPAADPPAPDPVRLEADQVKERAALAVAVAEERAELQTALNEERGKILAALEEERVSRQQALLELEQTRADGSARAAELEERMAALEAALAQEQIARRSAHDELIGARAETSSRSAELSSRNHQVEELRAQVEQGAGSVAAEQEAREQMKQLEARLSALEASLAAERTAHREAVEELDHVRSEASIEAKQLRSSVDRVRDELEQLDAATSWFEYWSGAASPTREREEQAQAE